jgi:predicted metal-dependent hydrolase
MTTPPRPFDPSTQRYAAHADLPSYRHVLGETPHPRTDPLGHSFGVADPIAMAPLAAASWRSNETYLLGIDLYNFAYWWEAHEQWEALWRLQGRSTATSSFLQGLIQVSASLLKWHGGNRPGFDRLAAKGCDKLQRVARAVEGAGYMGVDIERFVDQYRVFISQQSMIQPSTTSMPPRLLLQE